MVLNKCNKTFDEIWNSVDTTYFFTDITYDFCLYWIYLLLSLLMSFTIKIQLKFNIITF